MNPRVIYVEVLNQHQLLVTFTNQEQRIFDVSEYLTLPVFQVLANPAYFKQVEVAHGTVSWSDEVDFCPDTVYLKSKPISKESSCTAAF
jgi:hypothetical protein